MYMGCDLRSRSSLAVGQSWRGVCDKQGERETYPRVHQDPCDHLIMRLRIRVPAWIPVTALTWLGQHGLEEV